MVKKTNYRKYAVATMATAAAVASVAPVVASADTTATTNFDDVNDVTVPDQEMQDAIYRLVEEGAIRGFPDGEFKPADSINRGQVAEIIQKALDLPIPEDVEAVNSQFADTDDFYGKADYIAAVTEAGVFEGAHGSFDPQGDINRQQMATVLMRYLQGEGLEASEEHVDVNLDNVSETHKAGVQYLADLGLTTELDDYRAYEDVQRAQFATFFVRVMDTMAEANEVSVSVMDQTVNTTDATLPFMFNGEAADLEAIEEAGYTVTFNASKDVFDNGESSAESTSTTGKLADLPANESFKYAVTLEKDGEEVASSEQATVTVKDFETTFGEITDYTLKNDDVTLSSGTIVLGETVNFSDIKGMKLNGEEADISNADVSFESSDNNVALVNNAGEITPISAGEVVITISNDDVELEVPVEVAVDDRMIDTVEVDKAELKLANEQSGTVSIVAKDQYGDPVAGYDVVAEDVMNADDEVIASTEAATTDADGKADVTVNAANANVGSGMVTFADADDNEISTVNIVVSETGEVAESKIEFAADDDANLDVNPFKDDKTVDAVLNNYNADGLFIGENDLSGYTVTSTDDSVISFTESNGTITVTGKAEGTAKIQIKEGAFLVAEKEFTVADTTPTVESATFEKDIEITSTGALNLDEILKDENIVLNGEATDATIEKEIVDNKVVYTLEDADGVSEELGTLEAVPANIDTVKFANVSDEITLTKDGQFQSGDRGKIILKFVRDGIAEPVAVETVNVDIQ